MKRVFTLIIILLFSASGFAQIPAKKFENMPKGTFKKTWNGKIVQYDKSGKKVGLYKQNNGKYVKTK